MHEIGRGISANKMCAPRGRPGAKRLQQEERAAKNEDKGIASTPRGPVGASTISSTHVPLRYAYARAYVKDARSCSRCSALSARCKLQKSSCDLPPSDMSPLGFRRESFSQASFLPSLALLLQFSRPVCSRAILINSSTMQRGNAFLLYTFIRACTRIHYVMYGFRQPPLLSSNVKRYFGRTLASL